MPTPRAQAMQQHHMYRPASQLHMSASNVGAIHMHSELHWAFAACNSHCRCWHVSNSSFCLHACWGHVVMLDMNTIIGLFESYFGQHIKCLFALLTWPRQQNFSRNIWDAYMGTASDDDSCTLLLQLVSELNADLKSQQSQHQLRINAAILALCGLWLHESI